MGQKWGHWQLELVHGGAGPWWVVVARAELAWATLLALFPSICTVPQSLYLMAHQDMPTILLTWAARGIAPNMWVHVGKHWALGGACGGPWCCPGLKLPFFKPTDSMYES